MGHSMFEARAGREVMLLVRLADSRRINPTYIKDHS